MRLWKRHYTLGICLCSALLLSACGGGSSSNSSNTASMYSVGGNISGLLSGAAVVLQNNGGSSTAVSTNGSFSFASPVANGAGYSVTITTQPMGQTCTVASGSGTVNGANVTSVQVTCTVNTYTISGTVSGLASGAQIILGNNASDPTTVSANGSFSFATPVPYNSGYKVTVLTQPTGQICTVTSGSGTVSDTNVSGIQVTCVNTYAISGTVSGLSAGAQVTLLNNKGDATAVKANGSFSFPTRILGGGSYAVTVAVHPPTQRCTVSAGTGSGVVNNIANIGVACTAASESVIYSFIANTDAAGPNVRIIQGADGNFYGTSPSGGTNNLGTVFKITPAGVETVLYSFKGSTTDGSGPRSLIQGSDGNFYGTSYFGGTNNAGTVFKITPAGVETVLYSFAGGSYDGSLPSAGLIQGSDGNFYGTTSGGGPIGAGTVFKITSAGVKTQLYSFTGYDGIAPFGGVVEGSDGNFYGTTSGGGPSGKGTVFKVTPSGSMTILHSFTGGATDGDSPQAGLVLGGDGNFYGTTVSGGTSNHGTVFKFTPSGVETILYSFTGGTDGSQPQTELIQASDGNFYGTTWSGGSNDLGTVFRITPTGVKNVLHSFSGGATDGRNPTAPLMQGSDGNFYFPTATGGPGNSGLFIKLTPSGTRSVVYVFHVGLDGLNPTTLIQGNDGNFYGTTSVGGSGARGTVFKLTQDGIETVLHAFTGAPADGEQPTSLIQGSDGSFYGTTQKGGGSNYGTVFKITPDGIVTTIFSFPGGVGGSEPVGALIQGSDANFYGTTSLGGANGFGAVFQITTAGVETVLYSFNGGVDGSYPRGALIQGSDGNFYGTTMAGGISFYGTVFKMTPAGVETVLYSFKGGTTDGATPASVIQAADGNFYGTTTAGGTSGQGTVFKVTPLGIESVIYSFRGTAFGDGGNPNTALIQGNDGNFYGASTGGGISNRGTLFKVTPGGTESVLHNFGGNPDGRSPSAFIQGANGIFYGTTTNGGSGDAGTVFKF